MTAFLSASCLFPFPSSSNHALALHCPNPSNVVSLSRTQLLQYVPCCKLSGKVIIYRPSSFAVMADSLLKYRKIFRSSCSSNNPSVLLSRLLSLSVDDYDEVNCRLEGSVPSGS